MSVFETTINSNDASFIENRALMLESIESFRRIERAVIQSAKSKAPRYIERGLMPPRERLSRLLDPGTPFLELSTLCGYLQEGDSDGSAAGGGSIAGIGFVAGVRVVLIVDDYLTKGGSVTPLGSAKKLRMMKIATQCKLPVIALAQSGGGNLKLAADWFAFSGESFAEQARLSAAGIPQITVVHGSATAGGAYQPGLSDYVIMIRKQSTVYLAGPPLLKAATGEIATDEEIGGALMHAEIAGTADYLAENDSDGIRIAREISGKLGWTNDTEQGARQDFKQPLYPTEELLGIVPQDPKTPYDVREIIARIADASDFLDFKPDFDGGTVCGHIEVEGLPCGVIGNNAPITEKGAAKAGQFIQLCEQAGTPLLFLHNTTGFLVGTAMERGGIIKHGAKMIQAVTNCTVPRISIIVGGSYGAGNYAMSGRGIDPDFIFAWPRSVVSVMGPPQAGSVLRQVAEAKMRRTGEVDEVALSALEADIVESMTEKSQALANTARLWDDGLIDPRDTRDVLAFVLKTCREARMREVNANTFGIARL